MLQNGDDPDEIEIDLDKLDAATLRQLDRMVRDVQRYMCMCVRMYVCMCVCR